MAEAVFMSAGVPDPSRSPEYAATADVVAIASAVSALVYVTLGRRPLVWGGHPAITPMVWIVAEDLGVDYGSWVQLYQSRYFEEDFPEENARFRNVHHVEAVDNDRERSLFEMRRRMFTDFQYAAGVFIGGMKGILQEYQLFRNAQPTARTVPVASTGGAALELAESQLTLEEDLSRNLDYVALFHRHLGISPRERRYTRPEEQPPEEEDRIVSQGQRPK